jgi:hypothetical protein
MTQGEEDGEERPREREKIKLWYLFELLLQGG